jgi:ureidoglycolate lyase
MTIRSEPLTAEAFNPFGRVVERPGRDRDAEGPGWRWWADTVILASGDGRSYGVGFLDLRPAPHAFDWAERHERTEETVLATTSDILLYAAAAGDERPRVDDFRVFRIPGGSGVVMDRGVWHGAPLAVSTPTSAVVLILEGTGRDDVHVERFDAIPIELHEVR